MSAIPTSLAVRASVARFTFAYVWGHTLPPFSTWVSTNGCKNQGQKAELLAQSIHVAHRLRHNKKFSEIWKI